MPQKLSDLPSPILQKSALKNAAESCYDMAIKQISKIFQQEECTMLISEIMEKAGATTAADNMANHLADRVRNIWLKTPVWISGRRTSTRLPTA